ncbi:Protein of unknown function [Saccharicrinis carchari]|uniref:Pvc16 N-terminal domain-containing protein n=1 Tax=Saccharicrinis carchari TaxID=1168039 RepID=A0A521CXB5_SACCC|nr:DUF4255 domain-containing protein [Saccharicrinis carchari]SMO64079.1 Protein of unknown function [Saccharicrinis carchari]
MIFETLQILKEQLENYFAAINLEEDILLGNISLWESGSVEAKELNGKVVFTLLNIEEESTLKNSPSFKVVNNKTEYRNPPVNVNIFLLVSANCNTYERSLRSISKTIEFFQAKKIFTSSNTVYNRTNVAFDVLAYFKFVLVLYTPRFEELNNIWGTLGGRQLPSVLYKVQLVQIERDKKLASSELITHIGGNVEHIK